MLVYASRMDTKQIRKLNLRRLIAEAGSVKQLAEDADTDPNHLSAVASENPPKTPTGTIRGIGDRLARKLEIAGNKPPGWMDHLHEWGVEATMWMDRFAKLPEDRKSEAIEYLEFLLRKEGIDLTAEKDEETPDDNQQD